MNFSCVSLLITIPTESILGTAINLRLDLERVHFGATMMANSLQSLFERRARVKSALKKKTWETFPSFGFTMKL
ncbi:MAG: hypothetical protein HC862_09270 [Scytonema sp. RU_4_4]|nr:hypothetical protein [Scytonema sp. RU_4_4]